jgi:hypothetical protein
MKVKILKPCGIGGTHVCADDVVDVTKEDANTLFAYGLAVEPTDEDLSASKKGRKGGE